MPPKKENKLKEEFDLRLETLETELKILRLDFEELRKNVTPNSTISGFRKGGLT